MPRRTSFPTPSVALLLLSLTPVAALPASLPARAQTLDEILAGSAKARGGADRLAAVETIVGSGTAYLGAAGAEAPFRYEWQRPNRFRFELTIQGVIQVDASDGDVTWHLDPSEGPAANALSGLDRDNLNDAADFLGALVDPESKGHHLTLVGAKEVEGTPAWEIRVDRTEGFVETIYLDREYLVEMKEVERHPLPGGGSLELVTTWGDYKEVAGVELPHYWSRHPAADPQDRLTLVFESLKVNEPVPDEDFRMPEPEMKGGGV